MNDTLITIRTTTTRTTTTRTVKPANARKGYTLEELYELLQCSTVEIIPVGAGMILVVDEEGRRARKPLNPAASRIAGQPIVGDALHCKASRVK